LKVETRDLLIAGHFPHLPRLLQMLRPEADEAFPLHGVVALTRDEIDEEWRELWRLSPRHD